VRRSPPCHGRRLYRGIGAILRGRRSLKFGAGAGRRSESGTGSQDVTK
jgi:hypothetical protein